MSECELQRGLLSQLGSMLPHNPSVRDVCDRIVWLARELAWSDSAAVFLTVDGKLTTEVHRSPYHEALSRDSALGIQEPLIVRCLKEAAPCRLSPSDQQGHRIFAEDRWAVAIPIHDYGVVYLGRRDGPDFDEQALTNLVALGQQAHLAILVARLSVSRASLEIQEATSRRQAESLLRTMSTVVELMGELLSLTDPAKVLEKTGQNLFRLADFDYWAIVAGELDQAGEPTYFLTGPGRHLDLDPESILNLFRLGASSGRPLSLVNMDRLTLPRPSERIRSVLICPMLAESKVIGGLMMGCRRSSITRHERELLSTLALQVGSHFWNLHLHQRLRETHQSLKLSQAQLVQSSKMAAVGQLAAGVAHELNTPLGAMNLAIEGALKVFEKKPERAQDRLERALKSGNQLKEIVSKLLHYSKKTDSVGEETDLNQVVDDALGLIGHQLRLENVTLVTELETLPLVVVNKNEIQQVLINLLTNAKDAVVSKGGEDRQIVVRTGAVQGRVRLSVTDRGTGMTSETLEKLFDPFYTTKDVGKGTGLGLSVTKEIIERNNGEIVVDSVLGLGTTMSIWFG